MSTADPGPDPTTPPGPPKVTTLDKWTIVTLLEDLLDAVDDDDIDEYTRIYNELLEAGYLVSVVKRPEHHNQTNPVPPATT